MTSQPTDHNQHSENGTPDPPVLAHGRCRKCAYDITGLPAGVCPECAHPFDPLQPNTIAPHHARTRTLTRKSKIILVTLSLLILLFVGMQHTIIPRPSILRSGAIDPRLWIWLDEPYGDMVVDQTDRRLRIRWWAGDITRVTRIDNTLATTSPNNSHVLWEIIRHARDDWHIKAHAPGAPFAELLLAFNSMRSDEELLGVRIPDVGRELSEEPFEVRGPRHAVLDKLIVIYDLEVTPGVIPDSPGEAWVWNDVEQRLERLTIEQAAAREIEILPAWGYPSVHTGFPSVQRWDWRR